MSKHDPAATLPWMREGTAHLLTLVEKLTDDDLGAPSALPGWTRAHVVGHVARNAEALGRHVPHRTATSHTAEPVGRGHPLWEVGRPWR